MKRFIISLASMLAIAGASIPSFADVRYTLTDLGSGWAFDINDAGQVVGGIFDDIRDDPFIWDRITGLRIFKVGTSATAYGINNNGEVVGTGKWLYKNGSVQTLNAPNATLVYSYAINDSGQIAATIDLANGGQHVARFANGKMQDFGFYGGARDINNSGIVVGLFGYDIHNNFHAFVYDQSRIDLGTQGYLQSMATAINNKGQIALVAWTDYPHSYIYENGAFTDFPQLPGASAQDINERGDIVGFLQYYVAGNRTHAFIYTGGSSTDLNTLIDSSLGWTLSAAYAINNNGQIVGWGYNREGAVRAFVLTPIPEPASLPVLASAAVLLLRRRSR